MTDVVDELLSPSPAQQVAPKRLSPLPRQQSGDVVDELLSGSKTHTVTGLAGAQVNTAIARQQAGGVRLEDLPLANYDAGSDTWSDKGTVGFDTLTKAGVVDDPQTKLKIYADALKIPVDRMGMVDGQPIYLSDDGKLYRATPGGFLGGLKHAAADTVAHGPAIAAGAAGGALAGNIPGAIAGAALGAGAGEAVRKVAGNLVFDEPQTPGGNAADIAKEAAIGAGGTLMGAGLAKWLQRNVARDISRYDPAAAGDLQAKARAAGVDLTPAEITNLPSLKAQQKAVGNLPQSADIVDQFMQNRPGQVQNAAGKFLDTLSPEDSVELAGRRLKEGSVEAMAKVAQDRAAAAGPLYKRAFAETPGIDPANVPEAAQIMSRMPPGVVKEAQDIAKIEGLDLGNPANSLRGMHYLKLAMDRQIQAGNFEGVSGAKKNALQGLQKDLVAFMDKTSAVDDQGRSLYQQARSIYAHSSPGVTAVREGPLGQIADIPDSGVINAPKRLFDAANNGPIAVSRAMQDLRAADPDAANMSLRAFLQDKFEAAGTQFASRTSQAMQGSRFRAAMVGNKRQEEVLKAAMTGQQWGAFNDLMQVFEATGRAPMTGSDTAWNLESRKLLESQSGSKLADLAGLASPQDLGNKVREALKTGAVNRYAQKVAELITSPDGLARIKELKQLPIGSQKRLLGVSAALGLIGSNPIQSGLLPGADVPLGTIRDSLEGLQ